MCQNGASICPIVWYRPCFPPDNPFIVFAFVKVLRYECNKYNFYGQVSVSETVEELPKNYFLSLSKDVFLALNKVAPRPCSGSKIIIKRSRISVKSAY